MNTATAGWRVSCQWSLQRFLPGSNVHRCQYFIFRTLNFWLFDMLVFPSIFCLTFIFWLPSQGDCDYTSPPFRNLEIEEMIRNYELEVTWPLPFVCIYICICTCTLNCICICIWICVCISYKIWNIEVIYHPVSGFYISQRHTYMNE